MTFCGCGNLRPENAGQIIVVHHPEMEYGAGKCSLVRVGGETCDRGIVIHGRFWTEEEARLFATAMHKKTGHMADEDWLTKVSNEAAQRIKEWRDRGLFP
jgi:hypothetical protein